MLCALVFLQLGGPYVRLVLSIVAENTERSQQRS